jgi:energy-coupling factor transporter ATP-binding protein EcfA2
LLVYLYKNGRCCPQTLFFSLCFAFEKRFIMFQTEFPSFTQQQLNHLLQCVPRVHRALGRDDADLSDLPGWSELMGRPGRIIVHEGKVCLVCVLFGPSGAGKSTVFRLLTGIPVPAGETRRPMTFHPTAAVPEPLRDVLDLGELFPGYELHPLRDMEVLQNVSRDRGRPSKDLFFQYYRDDQAGRQSESSWLVLVDVPDFNTVELGNRTRAEAMLGRAETVIFLVYPEAYKDAAVMEQLRVAAGRAGQLVYVITKLSAPDPAEAARAIWEDVRNHVRQAPEFQSTRGDGRRIGEFVEQASVYYARRNAEPGLEDIRALDPDAPDFCSLVKGRDAVEVYWANLLEVVEQGLTAAQALAREAVATREELRGRLETANQRIAEVSERIAGSQFPAGELVELVIDVVKESRPRWLRMVTLPMARAAGMLLSLRGLFARFRKTERRAVLRDRRELERGRLEEAVDVLLAAWRRDNPLESELFSAGRCREAARCLQAHEPPPVRDDWKEALRTDVRDWSQTHPWYGSLVGTLSEMLVLLGGAALVLDLAVSGGIFGVAGQFGLAGAAGAGSLGAGTVLKMFEELKLKDILEKADAKWRAQRRDELEAHLREHLARPLFGQEWQERISALDEAEPEACLSAVEAIRAGWPRHHGSGGRP